MSHKNRGSSGQKRAAKAKKRAQKNHATVVSLADRSRRTAVDEYQGLIPAFHAWLLDSGISIGVEMAAAHVAGVGQAVDLLARDTIRFSATAWRTSDIDHLLEVVPGGEQARLLIAGEVAAYLLFLGESGLWTGSDDDFEDCIETVDAYVDVEERIWDQPVPTVDPDVEVAALTALPLVQRMSALLDWVGASRPVTSTGALKLAVVPEAAALFGHAVTTSARSSTTPALVDDTAASSDGPPRSVRSMWDVAGLSHAWTVAHDIGLLTSGSTAVTPGPAAALWHDPDESPGAFLALCREAVSGWLVTNLTSRGATRLTPYLQMLDQAVTVVLMMGFGDTPVPCDPDERRTAFETAPEGLLGLIDLVVETRAEALVADGFFDTTGGAYRIPEPLKPAVHGALTVLVGEGAVVETEPSRRVTLKVALCGMKPPVWRRITVDSGLPLCCLHDIIQACFDWDDSHLHQFTDGTGHRTGRTYLPAHQVNDDVGFARRDAVAEETVTISAALPEVGSKLTYEYDFGDSWIHEIVVEAIGEIDPDAPRAVCTAGRGRAPAEDCGGSWGWEHLVATVNDPTADEHEDMRDWLGLKPGERVDPTAFDLDVPNQRLRRLFR